MRLELSGIHKNNLKIDRLELPLHKVIFLTGPSGSGKSTLAREVLHKTGQWLYLESLGVKEGRSLLELEDLGVDQVKSLPPTLLLDQIPERVSSNREVGHFSSILPYLRLLMAISGTPHCPNCNRPIFVTTLNGIKDEIMSLPEGTRLTLTTPLPLTIRTLPFKEQIDWIISKGFVRVNVRGKSFLLEDMDNLNEKTLEELTIVIDRIVLKETSAARIYEAVRVVESLESKVLKVYASGGSERVYTFSLDYTCPDCLQTYPQLSSRTFSRQNPTFQCESCKGQGCDLCASTGLGDYARAVKLGKAHFDELHQMTIDELEAFLNSTFGPGDKVGKAGDNLVRAIKRRLKTVKGAGLGYLEVTRPLTAISRGEFQRLRLAVKVDLGVSGTLVILDEPTIGLHPNDYHYLLRLIDELKKRGNTLIIIEHEEELLSHCDWVLKLGPGSGLHGGRIIFNGPRDDYKKITPSKRTGYTPKPSSPISTISFKLLRINRQISIPLGGLTLITGESGSGKSRFLHEFLTPRLKKEGMTVDQLNQSPIRGNRQAIMATFLGIFTPIREIFSRTKGARIKGFGPATFSLAKDGGRCPVCKGTGKKRLDIEELSHIKAICPACGGLRYKEDVLTCQYKGLNIVQVLDLTVKEAVTFFSRFPKIRRPLETVLDAGMGYLTLGQPLYSLSGGEAMRLRLATLFAKKMHQAMGGLETHALLLDEPSAGLSREDVSVLVEQLVRLKKMGLTEVVIDHERAIEDASDLVVEFGNGGKTPGEKVVRLIRRF